MQRANEDLLECLNEVMCLDGLPYTGVAYSLGDQGKLELEVTYRDGVESGPKRAWYDTGEPMYEISVFRGVIHGKSREWHPNGNLSEEADYEIGFELRHKRWDEDGILIEEFELDKDDPGYKRLEKYRLAYKESIAEHEAFQARLHQS